MPKIRFLESGVRRSTASGKGILRSVDVGCPTSYHVALHAWTGGAPQRDSIQHQAGTTGSDPLKRTTRRLNIEELTLAETVF